MPAPATVDAFLEVLGKSGLVEPERLRAFLQQQAGPPAAPAKLAGRLVAAGLVTQFQAEQLLQGKHRGYTLGKYKVLERIGSGGHSTVYLCEHQVVRRKVAIKVLPSDRSENPGALARFYREARAAGALDHPNLVKAHDIDQDNGLHFIVMDYVDGTSLQALVSRVGPLAVGRAANYVGQAAQGLNAAHLAGLVHRDIKPANILLDRHGVVRVTDLGLARFFGGDDDSLTLKCDKNSVLGTADYVAPEQALNSHAVDIRADIYSLGGTFYFLLTGQTLFPGGKVGQKLIWHQTRQPTPVRQLRPEVPEELAAVVERMIQKDPAKRYQTPAEVIEALAPWAAVPVPPPSEEELPRRSPAVRPAGTESDSRSSIFLGPASGHLPPRVTGCGSRPELQLGGMPTATVAAPGPRTMTESPTPPVAAGLVDTPPAGAVAAPPAAAPEQPAVVRPSALLAAPAPAPRRRPNTSRPTARGLAVVLLLTVAVLAGAGLRWLRNDAPQRDPFAPPPNTFIVSHKAGDFPSVAAALRAAQPGARILVREPVWEEALSLGDGAIPRGVRIQGGLLVPVPVRWRPPQGHPPSQPLVQVSEGAGLTLHDFAFDGEGRVDNLVSLAGPCAGLTLLGVSLEGFRQNGVVLHHCTGSPDAPVALRGLRIRPGRAAASAVVLEARDGESNRHVHVHDCRLEGPYQAAVRLSGPATALELRRNRIFDADDGVFFARTVPPAALTLTLESNTFCALRQAGVHFEALPSAENRRVTLARNLFAHTAALVRVDGLEGRPQPLLLNASDNVRDRASAEGDAPLHAVEGNFEAPADAADDARFLRCPPTDLPKPAGAPPGERGSGR